MPTINQLVRKPRRPAVPQAEAPGHAGLPAEARRVPAGQDHDAQEAELGRCARWPACGCPTASK